MPEFPKVPTDKLYKFLAVLGLTLVLVSVVTPIGAMWHLQVQRNQLEGEQAEHLLNRDALVAEIARLQASGATYQARISETSNQIERDIKDIRKGVPGNANEPFTTEQTQRLMKIMQKGMKIQAELEKLEQADEPDEAAIHAKNDELTNLFVQMTKDMPADVTDAMQSALAARRLSNEFDRLASAAKPDPALVDKKKAEFITAVEDAKKKMDAVVRSRQDAQNRERVDFVSQAFQALAHVMILHADVLRFQNLVRESGAQLSDKTTQLKIAEAKLATKKSELDIVGQHNTVAMVGGVMGLLAGLGISAFGLWWWYQDERSVKRHAAAEEIRDLAYHKWELAGRPPGDGARFWHEAEQEVKKRLKAKTKGV